MINVKKVWALQKKRLSKALNDIPKGLNKSPSFRRAKNNLPDRTGSDGNNRQILYQPVLSLYQNVFRFYFTLRKVK